MHRSGILRRNIHVLTTAVRRLALGQRTSRTHLTAGSTSDHETHPNLHFTVWPQGEHHNHTNRARSVNRGALTAAAAKPLPGFSRDSPPLLRHKAGFGVWSRTAQSTPSTSSFKCTRRSHRTAVRSPHSMLRRQTQARTVRPMDDCVKHPWSMATLRRPGL